MAQLTKQFTFVPNTTINPDQVNANFDDIINFINTQCAHLDSPAFQGIPTLPAVDPTSSVHVASKGYVDSKVAASMPAQFGTYTGTTDGYALVSVPHSLGRAPVGAGATLNANVGPYEMAGATVKVMAATSSTITFKIFNGTVGMNNTACRLHWHVY